MDRFSKPNESFQFPSEYDIPTDQIQDQIQRGIAPLRVFTLNQNSAGTLVVNYPGRAFAVFSYNGGAVNQNPGVAIAVNENDLDRMIVPQDSRGFRGTFYRLFVSWPSQSGTTTYLVCYESDVDPFTRFR